MEKMELKKTFAYTFDAEGTHTMTVERTESKPNTEGYREGHDLIAFLIYGIGDEDNTKEQRTVLLSFEEVKNLITVLQSLVSLPF